MDYWDYLGWKDAFSDARFSQRQREYAEIVGPARLYTPQMIVNGATVFVGSDRGQGNNAIMQALKRAAEVEVVLKLKDVSDAGEISAEFEISGASPKSVLHLALVECGITRAIRSGENRGRTLQHENVVRAFQTYSLSETAQGRVELALPAGSVRRNCSLIAYVQETKTMRILGANRINL